ncbi:MAG TPA: hypothetical protein VKY85_08955 [Candidatus Angelobacter sp.]|nr:hypothetical protein [Candidatus Angelobacter sp.]
MKELEPRPEKFHIGIGSVFAGLMVFGGFESLIRIGRDPIARAVVHLINRFANSDALKLHEAPTNWLFVWLNVVVALIFLSSSVIVGARVLNKQPITAPAD